MKNKKYKLDTFSDGHFFQDFEEDQDFFFKKYIGGLLIFIHGKRMVWLCEKPGIKRWRKKTFKKDIWDGCLVASLSHCRIPLMRALPGSFVHPVITDSVYLPRSSENFEELMMKLVELIHSKSPLIGVEFDLTSPTSKVKRKPAR